MNKKNISSKITFILCFTLFTLILGLGIPFNQTVSKAAKKPYLASKSSTIFINGTYTISVKNKISGSTCFFTSNKTKIAKVNSKGTITGLGKGTAQIKVRYKLKGKFHTIGTFNITVKKSTINSKYKEDYDMTTGQTLSASKYLNTINTKATYVITSSDELIASGSSNGTITAHKAGKASLSIHEVYNKRSRTIGSVVVTVTGSSLKTTSVTMPYNSTLNITQFIDDINTTSTYTLASSDTSLVSVNDNILSSASSGSENKTCTITVSETTLDDNATHTIGKFTISLTNLSYIASENQTVYLGIGTRLEIGAEDNICISNPDKNATYTIVPTVTPTKTTVLSDNLVAQKYGNTTVSIKETVNGKSTVLPNTITVVVAKASIKDDLLTGDGFTTSIDGDTYGKYPVKCRNHSYTYSYEVKNKAVCDVNTAGSHPDEDYLIVTPKTIGNTVITVYEKTSTSSNKRTKVGTFGITVTADNSVALDPSEITAVDIIKSLSVTCNGKTYSGTVSSDDMTCSFADQDDNGLIDYGTNLENITPNDFNIVFKKSKYTIQNAETSDGSDWTFTIGLGKNNNPDPDDDSDDENEEATVELNVSLKTGEFNTASIIKSIKVKLGPTTKTITQTTPFYYDNTVMQFAEGNKDFEAQFTTAQFISAGATEYKDDVENPVSLSELKNVSCTVTQNTYNSKTNPTGNAAVTRISEATSDDNAEWTFTITFDDGNTEDCTVKLDTSDN